MGDRFLWGRVPIIHLFMKSTQLQGLVVYCSDITLKSTFLTVSWKLYKDQMHDPGVQMCNIAEKIEIVQYSSELGTEA